MEEQLWHKLRESFPELHTLPEEVLITVGYPASGARGRLDKIKPAEVNYQWQGNANEKAFISIHPAYFDTVENAMKAVLFAAGKFTGGARWGAHGVGLHKDNAGVLHATPETQAKLDSIRQLIGDPPSGFGVPYPVRNVQRTRMRRYVAADATCADGNTKHAIIRAASDTLDVECRDCHTRYKLE